MNRTFYALVSALVIALATSFVAGCAGNVNEAVSRSITAQLDRHQRLSEDGEPGNALLALDGVQAQVRMACTISEESCRAACGRARDISRAIRMWNNSGRSGLQWDADVRGLCIAAGTLPIDLQDRATLLDD